MDTRTAPPAIPHGPTYQQGVGPLGVDLATLADLPNDLRRRTMEALSGLESAIAVGDPDASAKATQTLTAIIAEIQAIKTSNDTTKLFAAAPRVSGTHAVIREFAKRAGVTA
jgi:hypothetical protein